MHRPDAPYDVSHRPLTGTRSNFRLHCLLLTVIAVAMLMAATGCAGPVREQGPLRVVPGTRGPSTTQTTPDAQGMLEIQGLDVTGGPIAIGQDAIGQNATGQTEQNATLQAANATAPVPAGQQFSDSRTGRRVPMSPDELERTRTAKIKELRKPSSTRMAGVTKNGKRFVVPLSPSQIKSRHTFGGYTETIIKPSLEPEFGRPPDRVTHYRSTDNMGAIPFQAPFFSVVCRNGEPGKEVYFKNRTGIEEWCIEDKWKLGSFCYATKEQALDVACAEVEAVADESAPLPATSQVPDAKPDAKTVAKVPAPATDTAAVAPPQAPAAPAVENSAATNEAQDVSEDEESSGFFGFMKALVGM